MRINRVVPKTSHCVVNVMGGRPAAFVFMLPTDAPKLKLVCLNLKGRVPKPQVNKIKIEESGGDLQKGKYLVDFVTFGFVKAFQHLVYVVRFALRLKHRIHIRKGIESKDSCPLCCVSKEFKTRGLDRLKLPVKRVEVLLTQQPDAQAFPGPKVVICSPLDSFMAWKYVCKVGTTNVRACYQSKPRKLAEFTEKDGILFGGCRLSYPELQTRDETEIKLFDEIDYVQPVFLSTDPVVYAIVMHVHWNLCPHSGVERSMAAVLKMVHVEKLRRLVKYVRETCNRCRYLLKRHFVPATGNQSLYSVILFHND